MKPDDDAMEALWITIGRLHQHHQTQVQVGLDYKRERDRLQWEVNRLTKELEDARRLPRAVSLG